LPAIVRVDPRSGVPIYLQIVEQITRAVAIGALLAGEQLPTVKALALELTINPNTVARAYRDLERDGIIETSPGRGSFVRGEAARGAAHDAARDAIARALDDVVRESKALGIEPADARALLERAIKQWYD
jgi:GntR family transcriptional regulator